MTRSPEVNVDSEVNFAAAEIEELLADGPASSEGGGQPWQSRCWRSRKTLVALVSWESGPSLLDP